ncbi:hypothetical protein ABIA33_006424 [Streptacidiphilus sp. MAP12-16]
MLPGSCARRRSSSEPTPAQVAEAQVRLIRVQPPSAAPDLIAVDLGETGIPCGLIGYEYRPLSAPVFLAGRGERGLIVVATSGLFQRIAVDVATGRVLQIPANEAAMANHVNGDLRSFNRCVAAVIARLPVPS